MKKNKAEIVEGLEEVLGFINENFDISWASRDLTEAIDWIENRQKYTLVEDEDLDCEYAIPVDKVEEWFDFEGRKGQEAYWTMVSYNDDFEFYME